MRLLSTALIFLFATITIYSQPKTTIVADRDTRILQDLEAEIKQADNTANMLLTSTGFNVLMQRRTFNYLTGASDLSLARFYGAYSSENDRLNLGFNIPTSNPYTKRLKFILNPIFELDVKNSFATIYKDTAWKNNIRFGFKITYLAGYRRLKFFSQGGRERKNDFKILRTNKYKEIAAKLAKEKAERITPIALIHDVTPVSHDKKGLTQKEWDKKEKEIYEDFGKMEADLVDKELTYNRIRTYWISIWGFTPLTKTEQYITPDILTPFQKKKFNLWELNFQASYLHDERRFGAFYLSSWVKLFQNNSANASLMKNVDYQQYSQLPGTIPINLALLETNKGYIGSYDEFITTNFNFQLLYFLPIYNTLVKPGISIRYEKNWGDYDPVDLKFGIPFNIQGKEKPINIELQYRIANVNNYKNVEDHKAGKSIGISLGFPFVALYK